MRQCDHEKAHLRMRISESTSFIAFGACATRTFKCERYFDLLAGTRGIPAAVRRKRLFLRKILLSELLVGECAEETDELRRLVMVNLPSSSSSSFSSRRRFSASLSGGVCEIDSVDLTGVDGEEGFEVAVEGEGDSDLND